MSEERETPAARAAEAPEVPANPGAPVEEAEASRTEVLEAVERATAEGSGAETAAADAEPADPAATTALPDAADEAELARRTAVSELDTQLDLEAPDRAALGAAGATAATERIAPADELPTAAALPEDKTPARDGEIRISSDHPMAALYLQSPVPPELKGNRAAGVLIALLATIGFAAVYAGVLALWLAPTYPPSTFLAEGLLPWLTSWPVIAAAAAFFVGLVLLVLVVGRAGWWAYVLGGFLVAAFVWAATAAGLAYFGSPSETPQEMIGGALGGLANWQGIVDRFGMTVPALGAALVAREATVWFGAWIGSRGRRVKRRNAEALAEYETALAESQATPE